MVATAETAIDRELPVRPINFGGAIFVASQSISRLGKMKVTESEGLVFRLRGSCPLYISRQRDRNEPQTAGP